MQKVDFQNCEFGYFGKPLLCEESLNFIRKVLKLQIIRG